MSTFMQEIFPFFRTTPAIPVTLQKDSCTRDESIMGCKH